MWPSHGLPRGTMAMVVWLKYNGVHGDRTPDLLPLSKALTKSDQPTCHAMVLNNHMFKYIFKFEWFTFRRGVGLGLSPSPWLYCYHMTLHGGACNMYFKRSPWL
jgi:hypothetical protein